MSIRGDNMKTLPSSAHKGRYPFRLGTTSFIYPAGWAENVARLAPFVDEVELLLFESQSPGSLPDNAELDDLARLAGDQELTYSVHLPVDVDLTAERPAERRRAAATLAGIYKRTGHLPVTSYTLHLTYPPQLSRQGQAVGRWQARARAGLEELLLAGITPQRISIENLDYPPAWTMPLVEDLELGVCIDIGHLILYGSQTWSGDDACGTVCQVLDQYRDRTAVLHLHGVSAGRDHRPLDELNAPLLRGVLERLHRDRYAASVSLEVFNLGALERSLDCFRRAWAQTTRKP